MNKIGLFTMVIITLLPLSVYSCKPSNGELAGDICEMSATEFKKLDAAGNLIIDVRTQREFEAGHLKGAILINIYDRDFLERIKSLDSNKNYFVYCKTGSRSFHAAKFMRQAGLANVCNLKGGIIDLKKAGVLLVK